MTEAKLRTTSAIALSIGRCAESMLDVDRLRGETNALKAHPGALASFAGALFELECAKQGDPDARANMLDTADQLLQFWRDKSGDQLAAVHPTLSQLWLDASQLLSSFDKKHRQSAFQACFDARGDPAALQRALQSLGPAGDRRVELATCLYHLELARLGVVGSRAEFARRIALVQEVYLAPELAKELVAGEPGLEQLWKELLPYLDEFFEAQEQEEEARKKLQSDPAVRTVPPPPARSDPMVKTVPPPTPPSPPPSPPSPGATSSVRKSRSPPPPPPQSDPAVAAVPPPQPSVPSIFVPEAEMLTSSEVEVLDAPEAHEEPAPPPPPKPPADDEGEILELEEAPTPVPSGPRPRPRDLDVLTDYEPDQQAQAFWRNTEAALGLLPETAAPRSGARVLSADGRAERKKLNAWLDGLQGHFSDVPEARAMQCLMRLYMAAQVKEKGLFGGANPKRKEAFKAALGLLSADGAAAGRAAIWFVLDGEETVSHLQNGLEVVADFLQFCARQKKDPLDPASIEEFL